MASVHMVCGFLGAGKTTFAKAVAQRNGAVRLSVDELYLRLFADGPTYELDERALQRLFEVLHDIWPAIVRAGTDVVLDFGFWRRELRDQVRAVARASGAATRLYWLQCPSETALARCLARNGTPGAFLISEHGFHERRARFESPGADESAELIDTS